MGLETLLEASQRPLIVAGHGIRLAGCDGRFRSWLEAIGIPAVTTWTGADLLPTDHPLNLGILGMCGQRSANAAMHHSDLILALGTHLSYAHTGAVRPYCPQAKKVFVNCDEGELANLTVEADLKLHMGLEEFFAPAPSEHRGREWDYSYFRGLNEPWPAGTSYALNEEMTRLLPEGSIMVVDGGGTALYTGFQSSHIKEGSRLICSTAISAMGSGLPEAVGACIASGRKMTSCLIGEGSLMLNVQELSTIVHHRLPIKIFVIVNGGYRAIKDTQDGYLGGRRRGVDARDLSFPNLVELAKAFGITYAYKDRIQAALDFDGPVLCELPVPEDQPMLHHVAGRPLSEMEFN